MGFCVARIMRAAKLPIASDPVTEAIEQCQQFAADVEYVAMQRPLLKPHQHRCLEFFQAALAMALRKRPTVVSCKTKN